MVTTERKATKEEIVQICQKVDKVNGWLSPNETIYLYELACNYEGKGRILEIGSFHGRSAIVLACGLIASGQDTKVLAIDPYEDNEEWNGSSNLEQFKGNIRTADVEGLIEQWRMTSKAASSKIQDDEAEIIFIDGDHSYEGVRSDSKSFFPKLRKGGVMAFHDTGLPGPHRLVREEIFGSSRFRNILFRDSIVAATKIDEAEYSLRDWLISKFVLGEWTLYCLTRPILTKVAPASIKSFVKRIIFR